MKVGVNFDIKGLPDYEYVYIFDKEPLEELLKKPIRCVNKNHIDFVDINLTDYDIECYKKTTLEDKEWDKLDKKDYKFAIIVPNCNNDHGEYKGKTYLQNCIESILNQTYKNYELIIVDDCSTDTSVETIKSYKDDRIHLIENKRKRYNGGARNVGIDYALETEFDYFCFLDSDDFWKHNRVLEIINKRLYDHEMAVIGAEMLFKDGVKYQTYNTWKTYEEFFMSIGKNTLWCTAWCRVIRKDKIVYFPTDTLMEDRTWSYEQADVISDMNKVVNIKEICYTWNRMNTTNSVSIVRDKVWEASAWKHVGQQLMLLERLKHKEMIPLIKKRIDKCKEKLKYGVYQQY